MPDMLNNREGPQTREPSKCLKGQSYGERLAKEVFQLPATRGSKNDSGRVITPAAEAVCVPAHLAPPGSPQAKQLCHLHVRPSLGQSCHGQNKSCIYACRVASIMFISLQPCTVSCQASLSGRGALQARILERIGQYWLPYPSRALYFPLP